MKSPRSSAVCDLGTWAPCRSVRWHRWCAGDLQVALCDAYFANDLDVILAIEDDLARRASLVGLCQAGVRGGR
jgi:hypothetical protein